MSTQKPSSGRPYSELYCQICDAVEASVQEKLERPLIESERLAIRNVGSMMQLESLERAILAAPTKEDAATILFDETPSSERRLRHTIESLEQKMEELLGRSLSSEEERKLRTLRLVEDAMRIAEHVVVAPSEQREAIFQSFITEQR